MEALFATLFIDVRKAAVSLYMECMYHRISLSWSLENLGEMSLWWYMIYAQSIVCPFHRFAPPNCNYHHL
jgi:hypothetical protein